MRRMVGLFAGLAIGACQTTATDGPAEDTAVSPSAASSLPAPTTPGVAQTLPVPDPSIQLAPEEQRIALAASQAPQIYM
ncbi:MAG: hypothetical protein AAF317_13975, partial [Pseudomonadota bacterium]